MTDLYDPWRKKLEEAVEALTVRRRKDRKRIKVLEESLEEMTSGVRADLDKLKEQLATLDEFVETFDIRQTRMGISLREVMKALSIKRP